ncbi:limonene 1,2-monooxygenase [Rhodoligotrophos appendicifer]|uniref:LLM class flavin-dependent oxidoreductase n=1 Tax=Rhodoligotrophos appendicifer TaxID=987056 RepID=UPI00117DEE24|nr:LLM class flavin-dependent oxidoreductase [Rhodoligotrophos appendicifer]
MTDFPLRHGIFLAPYHPVEEGPTTWMRNDLDLCRWWDDLGFDEVWVGEHHSGGYEMISSPELFIAAAAEITKRIRFGTGVITLPYHNPLMVANRITQLDHMTRGRVMFGFGPGLLVTDAHMLGLHAGQTRDRMIEALEVILRLLHGETVTKKTEWFELKDARVHLLPYTRPIPHLAVASAGTPSGGRAAGKYGLSMLCVAASEIGGFDVLGSNWQIANEVAAEYGNTMERGDLRLVAPLHIAETREKARENVRFGIERWAKYYDLVAPNPFDTKGRDVVDILIESKRAVIGTPDDAIAMIERLQAKQGAFGAFMAQHVDWADREQTRKSYELYARFVMPHFAKTNVNRVETLKWMADNDAAFKKERKSASEAAFVQHEEAKKARAKGSQAAE